jgi:hypothetical protein
VGDHLSPRYQLSHEHGHESDQERDVPHVAPNPRRRTRINDSSDVVMKKSTASALLDAVHGAEARTR